MKIIYCHTQFNGTYEYVHAYVSLEDAVDLSLAGETVAQCLVPDGWGLPGFIGWTDGERALAARYEQGQCRP
jgi:hypothetical protein